jgi:monoamine oxidase
MSLTRRVFIERLALFGGYSAAFSTMHLLGLLPSAEASDLPQLPADFGKGKKVVILGGGIAGLVSAYELRKAGFQCTILEARNRPGGRSWSIRNGSKVEFTDGTVQQCTWADGYLNPGPARIPSIHTNLLGYCQELGVPLEVEVNATRSAHLQAPQLNDGKPVEMRQVIYDTRGYLSELLSKAINKHTLDDELSKEDEQRLLAFLQDFGDLDQNYKYTGSSRSGFIKPPGAGLSQQQVRKPLKLTEILAADFSKGEQYEEQIDWQATMFQPIGGMDRIPYGFAKALGDLIQYESPVTEITTGDRSVTIAYTQSGTPKTCTADYCICTLPLAILAKTKNNFTPETQKAFTGMSMVPLFKIGWESPRFWEKDDHIYGGISFLKDDHIDLVWYPTDKLFSKTGVLVAGFNTEQDFMTGGPTPFGALPTIQAKLDASRAAVEKLHPGRSQLLTNPIYVNWSKIPYSLGCFANNFFPSSAAPYAELDNPEGRTYFAGDYLSRLVAWQEGAVLSAHHAIKRIAKQLHT